MRSAAEQSLESQPQEAGGSELRHEAPGVEAAVFVSSACCGRLWVREVAEDGLRLFLGADRGTVRPLWRLPKAEGDTEVAA